jgi:16S rRNA processing protein RimM
MSASPYVPLGRVVKTHGLKGEVSVAVAADLPFDLPEGLDVWFVPPPATVRAGRIEGVRPGPKGPLVKISGVDTIDAAYALCGAEMLAKRADIPDEWFEGAEEEFVADGMTVRDEEHGLLGEVVETIITGANDVWVVEGPFGQILLPVIDDVVLEIDEETDEILVKVLPGLMPGEGESA